MVFSSLTVHLFRRLCWSASWIFLLLIVLGGTGMLLSELERSAFSVTPNAFFWIVLGGLPGLIHHLLPISAFVALAAWGSAFRKERGWLALRVSGRGGRFLLRGVGVFSMLVALATLLVGLCLRDAGDALRADALWEGATPVAGKAVSLDGFSLLPLANSRAEQVDGVVFELQSPPAIGYAKSAFLNKQSYELILEDGRLEHMGEHKSRFTFSKMAIALPGVGRTTGELGHLPRERAEHLKMLSWPLTSFFLLLISLPLVLRSQTSVACAVWLGAWVVIRICDHQVGVLGPFVAAWLPCAITCLLLGWIWTKWEDA